MHSRALLLAQQRLRDRRAAAGVADPISTSVDSSWMASIGRVYEDAPDPAIPEAAPALPPAPASARARIKSDAPAWPGSPAVRTYPTLFAGATRRGCVPALRVWYLLRSLDDEGRGWLDWASAVDQLTTALPLGRDRITQTLRAGHKQFWHNDRKRDRIWLHGTTAVTGRLRCGRLRGRAVTVPTLRLLADTSSAKSLLYEAWLTGQPHSASPKARATIAEVAGVSAATQRRYDDLAGIQAQRNIALGARLTPERREATAWAHGRGFFTFTDGLGRVGAPGVSYVARILPNSYTTSLTCEKRNVQRRLNRAQDLLPTGTAGNSACDRLYFHDAAAASRACSQHAELVYYRFGSSLASSRRPSDLWSMWSGRA